MISLDDFLGVTWLSSRWMIFMISLDEFLGVTWLSSMCLSVCLSIALQRLRARVMV
jgi:hypothetical protein